MIPFKERLNPVTGVLDRIPWDIQRANIKLQEIRERHRARLNAEDNARAQSIGLAVDDGPLKTMKLVDRNGESADGDELALRDTRYVVDPIASSVKHSGAMLSDAFIPEWREFCSKPQNDDNVEYPTPVYKPKETAKRIPLEKLGPMVVTPVDQLPKKRGPGRPRKSEEL